MKKLLLIILSVVLLLTTVSCASKKQSTAETTTDPAETTPAVTDESGKPYKKLFEKLTPGTSVAKFKELLGGSFEHEDVYEGRNLRKYLCADGEIYVDMKTVFLEDGEVDLVVKSVSETCPPIPTHEKAVLEQITVGMKESEVYELLDDCGAWITSGVRTMEFLCTDGSKLRVQFDDFLDSVKLDYNVVKTVEFIEPKE